MTDLFVTGIEGTFEDDITFGDDVPGVRTAEVATTRKALIATLDADTLQEASEFEEVTGKPLNVYRMTLVGTVTEFLDEQDAEV